MDSDKFTPSNAFEGWVYSEICHLKKLFTNHLKSHEHIIRWFFAPIMVGIIILLIRTFLPK